MKAKKRRTCDFKDCMKGITEKNKSGLCMQHYRRLYMDSYRKKRIENHLCLDCGKEVQIIYPIRCKCCNKKNSQRYLSFNKGNEDLNNSKDIK